MQLRTISRLMLCCIILMATGCGQDTDREGDTVTVTPGDVPDSSP